MPGNPVASVSWDSAKRMNPRPELDSGYVSSRALEQLQRQAWHRSRSVLVTEEKPEHSATQLCEALLQAIDCPLVDLRVLWHAGCGQQAEAFDWLHFLSA